MTSGFRGIFVVQTEMGDRSNIGNAQPATRFKMHETKQRTFKQVTFEVSYFELV